MMAGTFLAVCVGGILMLTGYLLQLRHPSSQTAIAMAGVGFGLFIGAPGVLLFDLIS